MDKTMETSNMQDIVSLVRAVRSGDEAAFTGLYDRTKSIALRVIRRYCDTPSDYEDILQETYIRVFRSIAELKNEETVQAWINRIAANTAIRHNMKKKPVLFTEMADEEGNIPDIEDQNEAVDPEAVADKKAVTDIIMEVMKGPPEDQRDALWMVYGQRIPIREMAESLGISENTIKSRLFQGRKKLMAKKEEFRRLGIEISIIPVSVLVGIAFREDVYAGSLGAAAFAGAAATASGTAASTAAGAEAAGAASSSVGTSVGAAASASGSATSAGAASASAGLASQAGTAALGAAAASSGASGATAGAASAGLAGAAAAGKAAGIFASLSLGTKLAAAGVAAAVVIGGGAAVSTAISEGGSESQAIETSAESIESSSEADLILSSTDVSYSYDGPENEAAISAYKEVLETWPEFTEDVSYFDGIWLFDIDQDGIKELFVSLYRYRDDSYFYCLSFSDGNIHMDELDLFEPTSMAVIPEEGRVIVSNGGPSAWNGYILSYDGSTFINEQELFCSVGFEDDESQEALPWLEKAVYIEPIDLNQLDTELSGAGKEAKSLELRYDDLTGNMMADSLYHDSELYVRPAMDWIDDIPEKQELSIDGTYTGYYGSISIKKDGNEIEATGRLPVGYTEDGSEIAYEDTTLRLSRVYFPYIGDAEFYMYSFGSYVWDAYLLGFDGERLMFIFEDENDLKAPTWMAVKEGSESDQEEAPKIDAEGSRAALARSVSDTDERLAQGQDVRYLYDENDSGVSIYSDMEGHILKKEGSISDYAGNQIMDQFTVYYDTEPNSKGIYMPLSISGHINLGNADFEILIDRETGRVYSYRTTWLGTQNYEEEGISINTLCWTSYDFGYALRVAFEGVAGVSYWESLGFTAYDLKYSEDNYLL